VSKLRMEEEAGFYGDLRACFLRAVGWRRSSTKTEGTTDSSGAIGLLTKTRAVRFEAS
jgi:hypothetical protein